MDMQALRDYGQWLRKTPLEIRGHVIRAGGWAEVFPPDTTIPRWPSRVRNFFNEQPSMLTRVGEEEARFIINMIRLRRGNFLNQVLARGAFSGDVYRDQTGRHWIEQSQAGSRYHSKEQRGLLGAALTPHSMTGVFKLCSPDGTGGSSETALHNWMHGLTGRIGKRSATEVGHTINAATQAIVAEKYRGSLIVVIWGRSIGIARSYSLDLRKRVSATLRRQLAPFQSFRQLDTSNHLCRRKFRAKASRSDYYLFPF